MNSKIIKLFIFLFYISNAWSQNQGIIKRSDFKPVLLKVEVNYDQFQPEDTLLITCWWQNVGTTPSPKPLSGSLELSFGHQRIVETTNKFHRSYWQPFPATNNWQQGEIWKTTIRRKLNVGWGGSFKINIGLCDENHLPIPFRVKNNQEVLTIQPGQIEIGWSWGTPTVERMRKNWEVTYNKPLTITKHTQPIKNITIGTDAKVALIENSPIISSIGGLQNSLHSGNRLPILTLRDYNSDALYYSSERSVKVTYKTTKVTNNKVEYEGNVFYNQKKVASYTIAYEVINQQLFIKLKNVNEQNGFELLDITFPSLISQSGDDVKMLSFFGGGRLITLNKTRPEGYIFNYDVRNAAGIYNTQHQFVLESTCLDDKIIESVHENQSERTANIGMVLSNRILGKGKVKSIKVENEHTITIALLTNSGEEGWQSIAKYLRKDLKSKNRDLYRKTLFYKTLATSGPEPPVGRVKEDSPFGLKRLQTVIKFTDILDNIRKISNILDGMRQVNYIGGFEEGGFDNSYPFVFNTDARAGTIEDLKRCISEGKKFNAIVGLHDNYDTDVPGGNYYDPRIVAKDSEGNPWLGWIWAGGMEHIIAPFKYSQLGLMQDRVKKTIDLYGINTSYHLDVMSSEVLRYDFDEQYSASADKSHRGRLAIIDEFNKYGIDISSESLTHPFVGHIGHALWPRADKKTELFIGEQIIPLVPFIYHGTIAYCGPTNTDSDLLWNMIQGGRVYPSEEGITNKDIKSIYIQHMPLDCFYDKKMERYETDGIVTKVVYDRNSYVLTNRKQNTYEIVNDGVLIGKNWNSFIPGIDSGTYLAYSLQGGRMTFEVPKQWSKNVKPHAVTLTFEGQGKEVDCQIINGNLLLDMPAETPVRVSIKE